MKSCFYPLIGDKVGGEGGEGGGGGGEGGGGGLEMFPYLMFSDLWLAGRSDRHPLSDRHVVRSLYQPRPRDHSDQRGSPQHEHGHPQEQGHPAGHHLVHHRCGHLLRPQRGRLRHQEDQRDLLLYRTLSHVLRPLPRSANITS